MLDLKKSTDLLKGLLFASVIGLQACGGGSGGGDSNVVVEPPPPTSEKSTPYAQANEYSAVITAATVSGSNLSIDFQLSDEDGVAIIDLTQNDFSVTVAKLGFSPVGNLTGSWQSYINRIEQPGVGPGTEPKLQATSESGSSGTFVNHENGTYTYTLAASLDVTDADILAQAETEGLSLDYAPSRTHRVGMQFSNGPHPANPTFDWVPATGETEFDGVFGHEIATTESCNNCHENLALHGGGRVEVKYCVTCHNPGSTDANSGNTVAFKTMVHKIHMGRDLPSVQAGGVYQIYGFRDSLHDYSNLGFPGDILECEQCHVGNATASEGQTATVSGDNWREIATMEACGSCHDNVDFALHFGGQEDDSNCMSCHQNSAVAGSIENSHLNLTRLASADFEARILAISDTAPGEFPQVQFAVVNPNQDDAYYDILNDDEWQQSNSSLTVDIAWSTQDYTNTGNQGDNASAVQISALSEAVPVGDGTFSVTSSIAIPDGSLAPGIAITGSGAINIEGHPAVNVSNSGEADWQTVPLTNVVDYFNIDEAGGSAVARRDVADLDSCLTCHGQLSFHGSNRNDNVQACAICHNPRNTDKRVREIAANPPTDGKDEESLDFKTMIHGIHAAGMRNNALQIVGFRGFSTHVYDSDEVHYPANVGNCSSCHQGDSYQLPLAAGVLGTTIDTGDDRQDPLDDLVISPMSAVCSSCHDGATAIAHMEQNGGHFSTNQQDIDDGAVIEQCATCHGAGNSYAVEAVHPVDN